jgi:glycosyltransferase involved in cell wall biosynthesis
MPRFSVVVPLYNKAPHVAAALASVAAQSRPAHEVIVVDDGSTDGSREIVDRLGLPGLRLFERGVPGPGGYAARNLGIEKATGDWIAFLDADDLWAPDHLAELAAAIARRPGAGVAATRFVHAYDDGRRVPQRVATALARDGGADFAGFLSAWLAARECPVWTGATAIRRDVLLAAGLFPAGRATRGGDKDLWLRAVRHSPLAYHDAITADFHRDSVNKVSHATTTLGMPCLVTTARAMLDDAATSPPERRLLRALINQEIGYYARYALKSPGRLDIRARDVALPEGWRTLALLLAARWTPAKLRRAAYGFVRAGAAR